MELGGPRDVESLAFKHIARVDWDQQRGLGTFLDVQNIGFHARSTEYQNLHLDEI